MVGWKTKKIMKEMNHLKIISLLNITGFCIVWKYSGIITTEHRVMITWRNKYKNGNKCLQMHFKNPKNKH